MYKILNFIFSLNVNRELNVYILFYKRILKVKCFQIDDNYIIKEII